MPERWSRIDSLEGIRRRYMNRYRDEQMDRYRDRWIYRKIVLKKKNAGMLEPNRFVGRNSETIDGCRYRDGQMDRWEDCVLKPER